MSRKPTILIADDDRDFADSIARRCDSLGLEVWVRYDATEAITLAAQRRPDVICLDVNMPSGSGLSVCELIVKHDKLADVPVIMLTGNKDAETIRRCHQMAAYYVLKRPGVWDDLESLVRELVVLGEPRDSLRGVVGESASRDPIPAVIPSSGPRVLRTDRPPNQPTQRLVDAVFSLLGADKESFAEKAKRDPEQPPWILMIEDDRDYSWATKMRLESQGVAVVRAFDGTEGVRAAFSYQADLILLDFELPNGQGDYVLGQLKENPKTRDIPVIMATGCKSRGLEQRLLGMGAAAFFKKPLDMAALLDEMAKYIAVIPMEAQACVES